MEPRIYRSDGGSDCSMEWIMEQNRKEHKHFNGENILRFHSGHLVLEVMQTWDDGRDLGRERERERREDLNQMDLDLFHFFLSRNTSICILRFSISQMQEPGSGSDLFWRFTPGAKRRMRFSIKSDETKKMECHKLNWKIRNSLSLFLFLSSEYETELLLF